MNVLVTGGTGFIGGEICNKLLRKGHTIVLLTRTNDKIRADLQKPGIAIVPQDSPAATAPIERSGFELECGLGKIQVRCARKLTEPGKWLVATPTAACAGAGGS